MPEILLSETDGKAGGVLAGQSPRGKLNVGLIIGVTLIVTRYGEQAAAELKVYVLVPAILRSTAVTVLLLLSFHTPAYPFVEVAGNGSDVVELQRVTTVGRVAKLIFSFTTIVILAVTIVFCPKLGVKV